MVILDCCLGTTIDFHGFPHGFCTARGMCAASLKAKLIQRLESMRYKFLYDIFLDLHQAYNYLDRYRYLDILSVYGVVPQVI